MITDHRAQANRLAGTNTRLGTSEAASASMQAERRPQKKRDMMMNFTGWPLSSLLAFSERRLSVSLRLTMPGPKRRKSW